MVFFEEECSPVYVELIEFEESPLAITSAIIHAKTINKVVINPLGAGCLRIGYSHGLTP